MEDSYPTKTLHNQSEVFEGSKIDKANPVNFDFTFPAIREDDLKVVFDRALDYQTFDLYITTEQDVFKVRNCVITNGQFIIEKLRPLSMAVSGEASQLTRHGNPGVTRDPGATPVARDANRTYNRVSYVSITLGGSTTLSDDLVRLDVELQNQIKWTPFNIVGGCAATNTISYPENFTIEKRILSGSVVRYLTDSNNSDLLNWSIDTSLQIEAGQQVGGTVYGFDINMSNCMFINRLNTGEVYTQSYDWRLTQNPTNLSDIITYTTE